MQVVFDLNTFVPPEVTVVTQGTFDGVHTGHRKILGNIVDLAAGRKGKSVLVTFHPHPRHVLYKSENNIRLLTTFEEKVDLLRETGIDYLIVLPFDEYMAKMKAHRFIRDIMVEKIGVDVMVVGYDHRFGRNREGSFGDLKEFAHMFGFEVMEIAAHDINAATVSSTKIRNCLLEGDVETAALYLGREYSIRGEVVHGKKLGNTLGYPTANLHINTPDKLIPANGIYAVWAEVAGAKFGGMLSIGNNPTIEGAKWSIEVHIFGFNQTIYGEELTLTLVRRMRNEEKFDSLEALKAQLKVDEIQAQQILGLHH